MEKDRIKERLTRILKSNILLYIVVLILVLKITTSLISINFPHNIFFADITKSALENFINQTRQSAGLNPLSENEKLNQTARLKAEDMVQEGYFNHTSPSGITPWFWFKQAGYNYKYAGENLAIGFFDSQEVYNAWLNSPSHKENILNPNYTEVGTAVLGGFGANNTIVVVQEFGAQIPLQTMAKSANLTAPAAESQTETAVAEGSAEPVENPGDQTAAGDSAEKVLSQSSESQISFTPSSGNSSNNLRSRLLNFILYSYGNLLQYIVYGISLIVIGIFLVLIFFNFHMSFKKQLVYRAVLIAVLLSASILINKEIILSLIPHQVII